MAVVSFVEVGTTIDAESGAVVVAAVVGFAAVEFALEPNNAGRDMEEVSAAGTVL